MTPGLLLCALVTVWLKAGAAQAAPETTLAMQDITLSGRVIAPSCTVRLENSQLAFATTGKGKNKDEMAHDGTTQRLKLNVSECDTDGIGMRFTAEHWPDMPVRGMLRSVTGHAASEEWYYTLGPGDEHDATWPLKRTQNGEEPEADKGHIESDERRYYRLSGATYWYDLKTPLRDGSDMVIPLTVELHPAQRKESKTAQNDMDGTFTIQLSWR